jgi:hypothetical protein
MVQLSSLALRPTAATRRCSVARSGNQLRFEVPPGSVVSSITRLTPSTGHAREPASGNPGAAQYVLPAASIARARMALAGTATVAGRR